MPKYNVTDNRPNELPCRIMDANGLEWEKVVEVDTDTGDIICLVEDGQGGIVVEKICPQCGKVEATGRFCQCGLAIHYKAKTQKHKTAAPIMLIPRKD
jgi:hypothetical protein